MTAAVAPEPDERVDWLGSLPFFVVALALVALGHVSRQGLQLTIDFTAPVFWLFFLLVGVSLLVLRARTSVRTSLSRAALFRPSRSRGRGECSPH